MEGMTPRSFVDHLADLDLPALAALLRSRPDVLIEPVPRGFGQLAQRLESPDSLAAALWELNRDTLRVGQAAALLGESATVPRMAELLGALPDAVRAGVDDLCARGLAWTDTVVRLPEPLHNHWVEEISSARPVAKIARNVLVEDLRKAVTALGAPAENLRKTELVARLTELMSDARRIATIIASLPAPARQQLDDLRLATAGGYFPYMFPYTPFEEIHDRRAATRSIRQLITAGLVLGVGNRPELPREVAVAAWLARQDLGLTGPPDIPRPEVNEAAVRSSSQAAAQGAIRAVTALLDEAAAAPVVALKRGGVGGRERARLAKRLSTPLAELPLWIDLVAAAGLLAFTEGGYAPSPRFQEWREESPSHQWATLAAAWHALEHAPTSREGADEKDVPPPLPIGSGAGQIRRVLIRAAAGGRSVRLTAENLDWFFPLHGYDAATCKIKVAASIREAELLGVFALDVLSEPGQALIEAAPSTTDAAAATVGLMIVSTADELAAQVARTVRDLADRCAELLPATPSSLILQSDLTAVVSGQPSAAISQLLRAAAVPESRGAAGTWRFTSASVRAAMDAGWSATELLEQLRAIADHGLPQPLEYLIADVARRHGHVRVRGMRSAVLADEPTTAEILHTRTLAKLHLARLAPTVLASPVELDTVLAELRRTGFYPVAEDATGTVIVTSGPGRKAPRGAPAQPSRESRASRPHGGSPAGPPATRRRLTADELAQRLRTGNDDGVTLLTDLAQRLGEMNGRLNDAELAVLADAVERRSDVVIAYRDKQGTRTVRRIQPNQLFGRWLDSWCHLRNAEREFAIANIESVSPVG
ncbi:Helicase conserved C-terminal domain [Frankia sp. Allo2]|nr:hypothetical protein BMG523Draft_03264 [Frankia sp. BMG5.23]KFB03474.1 Helicase conserved C-terminal domain [Frankia sp. Allo2]OAA21821.1 Helicase conserved C-terminal domain-containing protein [Frankia casuarinae]